MTGVDVPIMALHDISNHTTNSGHSFTPTHITIINVKLSSMHKMIAIDAARNEKLVHLASY